MFRSAVASKIVLTGYLTLLAVSAQACAAPTDDASASSDSAQTAVRDTAQRGTLRYREGFDSLKDAAGVAVSITCEGGAAQSTKTGTHGEFAFKGPDGGLKETRTCTLAIAAAKSLCDDGGTPKPITWVAVGIDVGLTLDVKTCELRGDWQDIPSSL